MESKVQEKVKKALEKQGWLVVKIMLCSRPGWPDLQAHRRGETLFIECKDKGRKPEPLQEYRHKELKDQGFRVIVAYGPEDLN